MSELPELLREYAALDKHSIYQAEAMRKAAEEIERLRAEIEQLREDLHEAGDGDTWRAACKRCELEIERLRAELDSLRIENGKLCIRTVEVLGERDDCRRLLREAVEAAISDDENHPGWYASMIPDEWFVRAAKAAGGGE